MPPHYEALRPFLTDRISQLARDRLFNGFKFFDAHTLKPGLNRGEVKAAILLVKAVNPDEFISAEESLLINGCQRNRDAVKPVRKKSQPKSQKHTRKSRGESSNEALHRK